IPRNGSEPQQARLPKPSPIYPNSNHTSLCLSDDGENVFIFVSQGIFVFSWEKEQITAHLDVAEISKEIEFEVGGILDHQSLWIRIRDYNDFYLLIWNWETGEHNWSSLDVNLKGRHFENGWDFECTRLCIHPSKKAFLG